MSPNHSEKLLAALLRLIGVVLCSASLATLLPTPWMAYTHQLLGLGRFPDAPLTQYLTRSIAALYATHGGVLLVASLDTRRFAPIVTYLGWGHAAFGAAMIAIDFYARLPWHWTLAEGPGVLLAGLLILGLQNRATTPA